MYRDFLSVIIVAPVRPQSLGERNFRSHGRNDSASRRLTSALVTRREVCETCSIREPRKPVAIYAAVHYRVYLTIFKLSADPGGNVGLVDCSGLLGTPSDTRAR